MKKLLFLILLFPFIECTQSQVPFEGTVFFISEYNDKLPDKFAEVWIIPKSVLDTIGKRRFFDEMMAFRIKKVDYRSAVINELPNAAILKNELDTFSQELFFKFDTIQENKNTVSLQCDNDGKFKTMLTPGEYDIIVRSAHRKGLNMFDILGTMEIDPVTIKKNMDPIFIEIK